MKVKSQNLSLKHLTSIIFVLLSFFSFNLSFALDEEKVSEGNLDYLNRAFEKLARSDGAVAEGWDVVIGKSIVKNPTNFLSAYKKNKASVTRLDALVGNLGVEFVDDFKRKAIEIRKRIIALKSIQNKDLKPYANECINELQHQLKIVEMPIKP